MIGRGELQQGALSVKKIAELARDDSGVFERMLKQGVLSGELVTFGHCVLSRPEECLVQPHELGRWLIRSAYPIHVPPGSPLEYWLHEC